MILLVVTTSSLYGVPLVLQSKQVRRGAMNDKYVVKCEVPFKKYKIMALSGVRGRSPRLVEDKIYETVEAAYHGLFLRRIQDLMEA